MKIEVPEENREVIEQIDDLDQRLAWFLNEQAALERWRSAKHEADDRQLAAEVIQRAQELKQSPLDRAEVAERFLRRWDQMMSSIAR